MNLPGLSHEVSLWQKGIKFIAGIDEVGRGSWAGPVVAAGVILPKTFIVPSIFGDSKQLKPLQRQKLSKIIKQISVSYYIAQVNVSTINKVGIGRASQVAFRKVVKSLDPRPQFILIDAFYINHIAKKTQMAIKGGDQISASIAAASIIAKVYRDNLMKKLAKKYPYYSFGKHKGYGTKLHQEAIKKHGFSKVHRTSYNLGYLISK